MMNGFLIAICTFMITQSTTTWAEAETRSMMPDLETAQEVDLQRYTGKWYEILRLPQYFQKNCVGVTAEYSLRADSKLQIKNACFKNSCEGKIATAYGIGRVIDEVNNSKLKVSFFGPFEGDYWILELPADYSYAVVGTPDRKSFWILSRTPSLSDDLVENILERFRKKGFNFDSVIRTQPCQ